MIGFRITYFLRNIELVSMGALIRVAVFFKLIENQKTKQQKSNDFERRLPIKRNMFRVL